MASGGVSAWDRLRPGNYFAMSETDDLGNEDIGSAPWAYLSNAYPKASAVIFSDTKVREWLRG